LEPSEIHHALAQLPFPLIISTCHDRLMTRALEHAGKAPFVYRYNFKGDRRGNPDFLVPGSERTPVVYHLFGSCDDPNSLVLSENDLLEFLIAVIAETSPIPNCLLRVLRSKEGVDFLFVGFGIRHWYLRVLLKVLVKNLSPQSKGSAVALEPLLRMTPEFD